MEIRRSLILAAAVAGSSAPAAAADWSGFYAGVTGGYGTAHQSQRGGILVLPSSGGSAATQPSGGTSPTFSSVFTSTIADGGYGLSGGLVGGAVGYNLQTGKFVYGLAGDGSFADVSGSGTCGIGGANIHSCGGAIRSLGTVRGLVGYDLSSTFPTMGGLMVFGSGGLAIADVHARDSLFGTSGSRALTGWTAGGGLQFKLGPHWAVTLEYLHLDLGSHGLFTAIPPNVEHVQTTAEIGRVGLTYYFNDPAPTPVIARY